jgi:hypothetical protein
MLISYSTAKPVQAHIVTVNGHGWSCLAGVRPTAEAAQLLVAQIKRDGFSYMGMSHAPLGMRAEVTLGRSSPYSDAIAEASAAATCGVVGAEWSEVSGQYELVSEDRVTADTLRVYVQA